MSIMLRHVQALVDNDDQAIELRFHAHERNQNVVTALGSIGWTTLPYAIMTKQPNHRNEAATATSPIDLVLMDDHIMESIFTFLPITEQGKNKLVCHRWQDLNEKPIEISPKKAFETKEELRKAVLIYCNLAGLLDPLGRMLRQSTTSQLQMISYTYGNVINDWNVTKMEDFDGIFWNCRNFNENISAWNTSKAKSMRNMFDGASAFNQPLDTWNTSNVESMFCMFRGASSFNQPLNGWNTSNVESMFCMFQRATSFNQPLNAWNIVKVKVMSHMFEGASSFNQPLNGWNTSNVKNMYGMFQQAASFNQPLNAWNTSNVVNMSRMFSTASAFNQPLNAWNTFNVKFMYHMFQGALAFSHPIGMWDTSAIYDPNSMPLAGYQ